MRSKTVVKRSNNIKYYSSYSCLVVVDIEAQVLVDR